MPKEFLLPSGVALGLLVAALLLYAELSQMAGALMVAMADGYAGLASASPGLAITLYIALVAGPFLLWFVKR